MQAITEEGEKIFTCVDCEKWFEEEQLFPIHDGKDGSLKYHLCPECYKEDRRQMERDRKWLQND